MASTEPRASLVVRDERPDDREAVFATHAAAFERPDEAELVDRIRANGHARIALVAELETVLVGHILFSPVTLQCADGAVDGLGLAPLAVAPANQRAGIGGALVRAGLARCRALATPYVVVLGHPEYYPRFGFTNASAHHVDNEYGATEAFQVLELVPGGLPARGGLALYGPELRP